MNGSEVNKKKKKLKKQNSLGKSCIAMIQNAQMWMQVMKLWQKKFK